mmetsp:Transcript_75774/g.233942  ORF Transcript_75774/g.233942 Transcript_75774/m.233942 type:complete len:88 (+) Transcript_75774:2-265(+)
MPRGLLERLALHRRERRREGLGAARPTPWAELGAPGERGLLLHDLVHPNERGAALYAALIQAWLDGELAAGHHQRSLGPSARGPGAG